MLDIARKPTQTMDKQPMKPQYYKGKKILTLSNVKKQG